MDWNTNRKLKTKEKKILIENCLFEITFLLKDNPQLKFVVEILGQLKNYYVNFDQKEVIQMYGLNSRQFPDHYDNKQSLKIVQIKFYEKFNSVFLLLNKSLSRSLSSENFFCKFRLY